MGWEHTARQRRLAPIGEYRPGPYRVVVHDTFQQYRLRMAALAIENGMTVPELAKRMLPRPGSLAPGAIRGDPAGIVERHRCATA